MITVEIKLLSANGRRFDSDLATILIVNRGDSADPALGNYDVRAYRKGSLTKFNGDGFALWRSSTVKPIRTATVLRHKRLAEPVSNLVSKALNELGYSDQ